MFLSISEAEYVAASQCGQEMYYMREILRDFGYAQTVPTHICEDNLDCVAMSENPVRLRMERPRSPCEVRESLRQVERAQGEVRKPKCQRKED